jgi:rubrerythrin
MMENTISLNDIYKAAMQVEMIGRAYYLKYAEKSASEEIRRTFDFLAFREQMHFNKFQAILAQLDPAEAQKGISPHNRARISTLINHSIFECDKKPDVLLAKVKKVGDALQFALNLENDSIEFYENILPKLDGQGRKELPRIILEERLHAQLVRNLLENLP